MYTPRPKLDIKPARQTGYCYRRFLDILLTALTGDERERAVTGEAARATLLFGLSLQTILLVLSMVSVRLSWDPTVPKGEKHGLLSVRLGFSSSRHLDPFGTSLEKQRATLSLGAVDPKASEIDIAGGFLLAPSTFPLLALIILIQLAAFKLFAMGRYEGIDALAEP